MFPEAMWKEIKIESIVAKEVTKLVKEIEEGTQILAITKCQFTQPYTSGCVKNIDRKLDCGISAEGKACSQCHTRDHLDSLEKIVKDLTKDPINGKVIILSTHIH